VARKTKKRVVKKRAEILLLHNAMEPKPPEKGVKTTPVGKRVLKTIKEGGAREKFLGGLLGSGGRRVRDNLRQGGSIYTEGKWPVVTMQTKEKNMLITEVLGRGIKGTFN